MRYPPLIAFAGSLLIAACSAEQRNPSEPHTFVLRPSFSLGAGGIENTSCDYNVAWVRDGGHASFSIAFSGNQCGDLPFEDQTRTVDVSWVPGHGAFPSGYNSWQVKYRRLSELEGDIMAVLSQQFVPADSQAEASLPVDLPSNADAVALRLFINTTGAVATTAAEFDGAVDEAAVQHWRHVEPPVLDSVVALSQSTVRLYWHNGNHERSYDQTQVFRDGQLVGHTFGTTRTFTDTLVAAGFHRYQLRHVTQPSPQGLGVPNSAYSAEDTVTLVTPPPDYTNFVYSDLIIFMDTTYSWTRAVYGGTSPYQDQWYYADSTSYTFIWTDPTPVGENSPTYSRFVTRLEWDFAFIVTDSTTDANGRTVGDSSLNWVIGTNSPMMQFSSLPPDQLGRRLNGRCVPLPARGRARHEWMERVIRSGRGPELCALAQS